MQYTEVHGYRISRLTLGTVALGLDYSISDNEEQPSQEESFEILSCALRAGINTLDTARSYGNAEELIGRFLQQNKTGSPVNVVTKFKVKPEHMADREQLKKEVYYSVRSSLGYLKLERIPVCLLHMDRRLPAGQMAEALPAVIDELKKDGLIDIGGVSVDHPREVESFLDRPAIEAVQVPLNIFDLRLVNNGMLKRMQEKNKIVFVRSIFLKGLFFMHKAELKGNLVAAGKYLDTLQELANQAGMSIAELAFSFVRDMEGITSIVFGAVNAGQVSRNIRLLEGRPLGAELRTSVQVLFAEMPEDILTPGLWSV